MHRDSTFSSCGTLPNLYDRRMADDDNDSPKLIPDSAADDLSSDPSPEPAVSRVPQKVTRTSSPLTPIALVVALIAAGLAVWALVKSPETSPPAASSSTQSDTTEGTTTEVTQSGDPKQRVCDAAQVVAVSVQLQTNANIGSEPAAVEAVAANARLAMLGGGDYLLSQIDADTPKDLADAARSFGSTLKTIGINALAGVPNSDPAQDGRLRQAEKTRNTLAGLCTK
ncbi:hypothetical protein NGTWS0302_31630 [Mycolicibacterium cyprinidarum]|uniref:Alanine and proline rich membrane protein n=1 Tax=Mycolicibacterium cyprinidarum TaxID=2860311 RepID=A0ABQ4V4R1_9MYCO|nr:hypothetical protein NGTWS1702_05560 [Mycolicibacterium sp. NGTWSNA01]GJF12570.1 hypothetical protein NGTWS0302_31630 [Mycolicibacterium sp. NGTWS0302]